MFTHLIFHKIVWIFIFYILYIHYIIYWWIVFFWQKLILFFRIFILSLRWYRWRRWQISFTFINIALFFEIPKSWILVLILFLNDLLTNLILFILHWLLWFFKWKRAVAIVRLGKAFKSSLWILGCFIIELLRL